MRKSVQAGGLFLTTIIAFPIMLYVMRPAAVPHADTGTNSIASTGMDRRQVFFAAPVMEEAEVRQDEAGREGEREKTGVATEPNMPVATNDFRASQVEEAQSGFMPARIGGEWTGHSVMASAAGESRSIVENQQPRATDRRSEASPRDDAAIARENTHLYLAESDYSAQETAQKCPPVYRQLNDYARNMRIAMGCELP